MQLLHSYIPDPIFFEFGSVVIHWYGLLMTLAIVAGVFVAVRVARMYGIDRTYVFDLAFYLVIFGLLGARVYHVLNELPYYLDHPSQIIAFWNGGLALHGALLAGIGVVGWYLHRHSELVSESQATTLYFLKHNKLLITNYQLLIADILAPALALGQAIGRWGNYVNQELYGSPTNLPWGIPIALEHRITGFEEFTFFHPTFLYESVLSFAIFILLILLLRYRIQRSDKQNKERTAYSLLLTAYVVPGSIAAVYLIAYSIVRIAMESLRIDYTPLILGIRLPIITSSILIIVSLFVLWYIHRSMNKER